MREGWLFSHIIEAGKQERIVTCEETIVTAFAFLRGPLNCHLILSAKD